jgi:tRNA G46 methylase TrmB
MYFLVQNPQSRPPQPVGRTDPTQKPTKMSDNQRPGVHFSMLSGYFQDYPEIALLPETFRDKNDFLSVFRTTAPIEVEIGSGKGTFLVSQAQAHPGTNFLGI